MQRSPVYVWVSRHEADIEVKRNDVKGSPLYWTVVDPFSDIMPPAHRKIRIIQFRSRPQMCALVSPPGILLGGNMVKRIDRVLVHRLRLTLTL